MGPVFRAYDAEHERLVAVKLFKLDLPPERVHQLVSEFEQLIAADLNHPAIARALATGISGVAAYLAQEYVAAESLDLAVREYGPAPPADALRVAAQLGGALDFAAVVNVRHGALHPRDVLLSPDDTRVTGIGVAQALQKVGVAVPVRRPYTAPEMVTADMARGWTGAATADIFSLAAIVYELLTGKRVAGAGDQAVDVLGDVAGADARALRHAFARALAEQPADRFETALEFVEALKQAWPDVTLKPSGVDGGQSTVDSRKGRRPRKTDEDRPPAAPVLPMLPLDEPELTDRADVEVPVELPPLPEPVLREEPIVPDLPLAAAEERRFADVEAGPHLTAADHVADEPPNIVVPAVPSEAGAPSAVPHEVFAAAIEQSRSAVWPLVLALLVGIAVGFAAGYGVGGRQASVATPPVVGPAATPPAGKEFTETAVPAAPAPEPRVATPEPRQTPEPRSNPDSRAATAESAALPGRLLVRSTPAGAKVTVDGRDAGVTPAVVRDLAPGAHRVHVTRDGYAAVEQRVVITRARPSQSLTLPLARERVAPPSRAAQAAATPEPATPGTMGRFVGTLYVDSRPSGARVFVDGKLVGTTPLAMPSVAAGEHAVRLESDGYRRWTSSVRVVASEQNKVTASLER